MARRIALLLAIASVVMLGWTGPAGALINGLPDSSHHPYVGIIFNSEEFCTATAISPTVLITAAHCLENGAEFSVSFAEHPVLDADGWPDPSAPDLTHGAAVDITDYCGLAGTCGPGLPGFADPDVAVVVLDSAINLARYAILPQPGVVDQLSSRQELTLVGYGVNRIRRGGGQPAFVAEIARRTMTADRQPIGAKLDAEFIAYRSRGGSTGMCFGDSGGPVLLGNTIVGVNSFINGMCSSRDVGTRLDRAELLVAIGSFR